MVPCHHSPAEIILLLLFSLLLLQSMMVLMMTMMRMIRACVVHLGSQLMRCLPGEEYADVEIPAAAARDDDDDDQNDDW